MIRALYRRLLDQLLQNGIYAKNVSYGKYWKEILQPQLEDAVYVNIGAGNFRLPGWEILDYDTPDYNYSKDLKFIQFDVNAEDGVPFGDDDVAGVYCSHVLEHFDDEAGSRLLREICRVLRPGGIARIVVPDAQIAYRALTKNDDAFFVWDYWNSKRNRFKSFSRSRPSDWPIEMKWLHRFATERVPDDISDTKYNVDLESLKGLISALPYEELHNVLTDPLKYEYEKSSNHINWYDYEKVSRFLRGEHNISVSRSSYLQCADPHMRVEGFFDSTWPQMSLFVDIEKRT